MTKHLQAFQAFFFCWIFFFCTLHSSPLLKLKKRILSISKLCILQSLSIENLLDTCYRTQFKAVVDVHAGFYMLRSCINTTNLAEYPNRKQHRSVQYNNHPMDTGQVQSSTTAAAVCVAHGHPRNSQFASKIEVMSHLFIQSFFWLEVSWGNFWFGFILHPKMI